MPNISVVIPSRNEPFLQQTIDSVLDNADGSVEVIVHLDGYWPDPIIKDDERVTLIHRSEAVGMRGGINAAVALAKADHILKLDAQCMMGPNWDTHLLKRENRRGNWVIIPRRKRLDADNWEIQDVGKPDVDYEFLTYPDNETDWGGASLNGRIWDQRCADRQEKMVDENMSFQGSCWFMKKNYFYELELMDEENYGPFWNEAQEIGLKCWLSGGKVVTNKNVWYAHLHKGKKHGRGYHLPEKWLLQGRAQTIKWMEFGKAWDKQTVPLSSLIERFGSVPSWTPERIQALKDRGN